MREIETVFYCVSCTLNNLAVKVHYGGGNRQPLATGKGVHREEESEVKPTAKSRPEEEVGKLSKMMKLYKKTAPKF